MEQPLHISHTAQEITAYSPIIFMLEIRRKKFPFCNPLPTTPFWISRELSHKSQNHLNHFPCPFPLHQPPSPDPPALYSLLTKHLLTAVTWFEKHLYIHIYIIKTTEITCFGWNFSHIPVHFWNIWMASKGSPKTLWIGELRSSSGDSLEQTLPTNKLSNHLMQAVEKIMSNLLFQINSSGCKDQIARTQLSLLS